MRNKILIFLLLISSYCFGQTSVPNTDTFSLNDVYTAVHAHTSGTATNLQSCFTNAISGYFNATYNQDSYAPANSMLRFRDYKPTGCSAPTVTTADVSDLYKYVFSNPDETYFYYTRYGGNVTNEGSSSVTARGIVYSSTNGTPTIGGSGVTQKANGTGGGAFSSDEYGLIHGTLYYFRAYAVNSCGTTYGSVKTFTECERNGSAIDQGVFNSQYTYNGTFIEFWRNLTDAQTALYNWKYNTALCGVFSAATIYSVSLSNGNLVYFTNNSLVACDLINGYWIDRVSNPYRILYVVDGVIQSISTYSP